MLANLTLLALTSGRWQQSRVVALRENRPASRTHNNRRLLDLESAGFCVCCHPPTPTTTKAPVPTCTQSGSSKCRHAKSDCLDKQRRQSSKRSDNLTKHSCRRTTPLSFTIPTAFLLERDHYSSKCVEHTQCWERPCRETARESSHTRQHPMFCSVKGSANTTSPSTHSQGPPPLAPSTGNQHTHHTNHGSLEEGALPLSREGLALFGLGDGLVHVWQQLLFENLPGTTKDSTARDNQEGRQSTMSGEAVMGAKGGGWK